MGIAYLSIPDFNRLLGMLGRSIQLFKSVKTVDSYGSETLTRPAATTITGIFLRQSQAWTFDKVGEIEGGNATLLAKYSDGIKRNHTIRVDGVEYLVKNIIDVPGRMDTANTTFVYSYCNLFIQDEG